MNKATTSSLLTLIGASLAASAQAVTIQLVADNDFAVYAGTSSTITRSIYQNGVVWDDQIAAAASFSFELEPGENTYYVLAMGGGVEENISGRINGVNLVDVFTLDNQAIRQSANVASFLSGYNSTAVANGSFTPVLSDVQTALAGTTFGSPTVDSGRQVINGNPFSLSALSNTQVGFAFPAGTAVLYKFASEEVASPIPEPSSAAALVGLAALGFVAGRRRRA